MIPLPNANSHTRPAFTPDRQGVTAARLAINTDTGAISARVTLRPATATEWGPTDLPPLHANDLVGEIMAAPDSAEKTAALAAVQDVTAGLVTVTAFLVAQRNA